MKCGCHSHGGFLTSKGIEVAQRERERHEVDGMALKQYLDRSGSVSALIEIENDCEYDSKHIELNTTALFLQVEMF